MIIINPVNIKCCPVTPKPSVTPTKSVTPTVTPTITPTNSSNTIQVSGAGTLEANGTYDLAGTYNGYNYYAKNSISYIYVETVSGTGIIWIIGDTLGDDSNYWYYNNDLQNIPPSSGWLINSGSVPAPTLS
jgi:hypothetical protein